jgi:hypothetical protein
MKLLLKICFVATYFVNLFAYGYPPGLSLRDYYHSGHTTAEYSIFEVKPTNGYGIQDSTTGYLISDVATTEGTIFAEFTEPKNIDKITETRFPEVECNDMHEEASGVETIGGETSDNPTEAKEPPIESGPGFMEKIKQFNCKFNPLMWLVTFFMPFC